METGNPIARLGVSIRRIVCTILDEPTARREIETVIRETAREMNVPAIAVHQRHTNELLKLPLHERVKRLRQLGHDIPEEWTRLAVR
jgi:hypothetical protein